MPIQCQSCVNLMSILYQSNVTPVPIKHQCQSGANTLPIIYQSSANPMSTHCQLFANPQSIHRQFIANRVRIQFKSIVNPCQYKSTLMPIHCQSSVNLLPIQVNPPPMRHKSSQSTNLTFQCLFVTNLPIRDKFANSFHFSQSIADPMAIRTQL